MVTAPALSKAISMFGLTEYSPLRGDLGAQEALGGMLASNAASDEDLAELTDRAIRDSAGEWPGLAGIYEPARVLKHERRLAADEAAARKECAEHEAACSGYFVTVDDDERTVSVLAYRREWRIDIFLGQGSGWGKMPVCECRRGRRVNEADILVRNFSSGRVTNRSRRTSAVRTWNSSLR